MQKYKKSKIIVFLIIKTYYFTERRVTKVQFPYAFYLLAGLRSQLIFKRLRLLTFFRSGSGSCFFLQAAPAPAPRSSGGVKENTPPPLPSHHQRKRGLKKIPHPWIGWPEYIALYLCEVVVGVCDVGLQGLGLVPKSELRKNWKMYLIYLLLFFFIYLFPPFSDFTFTFPKFIYLNNNR